MICSSGQTLPENIRTEKANFEQCISSMRTIVNSMSGVFEGEAATAFVSNFESYNAQFTSFGELLESFAQKLDTGDNVIVINAEKIKVTGKKLDQKVYYHHSDYVGGMKETTLREMMAKKPEQVIELAVKGMLPKGPLGRTMIKKLHVYAGAEHAHQAQKPEVLTF